MSKLTVHLVTWNGAKYIPHLFDSLRKQLFSDWELIILDNASKDNTVELIKKELINFSRPHQLTLSPENTGFAGGHNRLYKQTDSEYFLLLNQDMYLEADCLQKMVDFLEQHPSAAAVTPRLMKWNIKNIDQGLEKSFTTTIDALGLRVFRNRRVIEQYTQEEWLVIKTTLGVQNPLPVFGVSGAFPLYRRSAIQKVAFSDSSMFDESYHLYKEDVDLAFRLVAAAFTSFVLLDVVAYHDRGGAGPKEMNDLAAAMNKKGQSEWVRYHSYKNHLRTILKNEYWQNALLDLPWILWYELKKFVYFALFDRHVLAGLKELWQGRADLLKKRKEINAKRIISWRTLRHWWYARY